LAVSRPGCVDRDANCYRLYNGWPYDTVWILELFGYKSVGIIIPFGNNINDNILIIEYYNILL